MYESAAKGLHKVEHDKRNPKLLMRVPKLRGTRLIHCTYAVGQTREDERSSYERAGEQEREQESRICATHQEVLG